MRGDTVVAPQKVKGMKIPPGMKFTVLSISRADDAEDAICWLNNEAGTLGLCPKLMKGFTLEMQR